MESSFRSLISERDRLRLLLTRGLTLELYRRLGVYRLSWGLYDIRLLRPNLEYLVESSMRSDWIPFSSVFGLFEDRLMVFSMVFAKSFLLIRTTVEELGGVGEVPRVHTDTGTKTSSEELSDSSSSFSSSSPSSSGEVSLETGVSTAASFSLICGSFTASLSIDLLSAISLARLTDRALKSLAERYDIDELFVYLGLNPGDVEGFLLDIRYEDP